MFSCSEGQSCQHTRSMLIHSDGRKRGDEKSREGKKKGPDATEAFVKVTQTPSSTPVVGIWVWSSVTERCQLSGIKSDVTSSSADAIADNRNFWINVRVPTGIRHIRAQTMWSCCRYYCLRWQTCFFRSSKVNILYFFRDKSSFSYSHSAGYFKGK